MTDPTTLQVVWFGLIAVLWIGYLVLEGFDFGVGMLLPVLDKNVDGVRDDRRRRVMINTIAPVWDGNEVWLITAVGATFAAFPDWYATLLSGFYLPLLLILVALILRGMAFDYRGKRTSPTWHAWWDAAIIGGSFVPSLLWGVMFANLVQGVPINEAKQFTGTVFTLLNPFGLLGGVTTVLLFLLHGAIFLALKTKGDIQQDAEKIAARLAIPTTAVVAAWTIWLHLAYSNNTWTWLPLAVTIVALVVAIVLTRAGAEGKAFITTCVAVASAVVLIFGALYPNVMLSSTNEAWSLTIMNASSTDYTLKVVTVVAVLMTPVVMIYQGWTYWVFRKRLTVDAMPAYAETPVKDVKPIR